MDEVTITTDDGAESPEESAAHQAAIAEGATAVHAGNAEEASEEAKAAAEAALAGASATVEAAVVTEEHAERAELAANRTEQLLSAVHEAVVAQQTSLDAFMEEIRASRKKPEPKPEPVKQTHDTPPAPKKRPRGLMFK